jgi:hypothetical protein
MPASPASRFKPGGYSAASICRHAAATICACSEATPLLPAAPRRLGRYPAASANSAVSKKSTFSRRGSRDGLPGQQ